MNIIYESDYGKIIHGDNIEVMKDIPDNTYDSCISDFPYAIEFMGKAWDSNKNWNQGNGIHGQFSGTGYSGKKRPAFYANTPEDKLRFYDWCYERALELMRIIKPGGYAAIFGHPKANHRMKCAFEDAGFNIVEEIDYLYLSGMPKNQDIGKLFDKMVDADRDAKSEFVDYNCSDEYSVTKQKSPQAIKWSGYKTSGLKPAHEPITIFQKPLDGTYVQNIERWGCGAMNIDACRVPMSQDDIDMINAKSSKNPTTTYADRNDKVFGRFNADIATPANDLGRFPPNIVIDDCIASEIDAQTGITKSCGGSGSASRVSRCKFTYGAYNETTNDKYINESLGGYGDCGGGSRIFPIFKYNAKVSPSERELPNGERNPHVTVKPVELIKWLIRLMTPIGGSTIDITAGSCTHGVACEELNFDEKYKLHWINIELMNTDSDPYCNVGKLRVESINNGKSKRLF